MLNALMPMFEKKAPGAMFSIVDGRLIASNLSQYCTALLSIVFSVDGNFKDVISSQPYIALLFTVSKFSGNVMDVHLEYQKA